MAPRKRDDGGTAIDVVIAEPIANALDHKLDAILAFARLMRRHPSIREENAALIEQWHEALLQDGTDRRARTVLLLRAWDVVHALMPERGSMPRADTPPGRALIVEMIDALHEATDDLGFVRANERTIDLIVKVLKPKAPRRRAHSAQKPGSRYVAGVIIAATRAFDSRVHHAAPTPRDVDRIAQKIDGEIRNALGNANKSR